MGRTEARGATEVSEELSRRLVATARRIRVEVLKMIHAASSGHPGGSLSAADIVTALYFHHMRVRPSEPTWPDRDRFILSKGHACPVWYAALALKGYFPVETLATLRALGSPLQGHPSMKNCPGIDITTGSLGNGLSAGLGMALAGRMDARDYRVFVMLGDGELNEGVVWEAAMCAGKYRPANLIAIVDHNHLQLDGTTDEVMPLEPLSDKWRAFGWCVLETDGNEMERVVSTIDDAITHTDGPTVIVAHTVKGKGVSYMENACGWHGRAPSDDELAIAMRELGEASQ